MDPLEREQLLREIDRYGYHLIQPDSAPVATTLYRMLSSDDGRLLEGVPVVLTNILMRGHSIDLHEIENQLPSGLKRRFRILVAVTYLFMFWVPDSDSIRDRLLDYLQDREPSLIENVQSDLRHHAEIKLGGGARLDPGRLERIYKDYVVEQFMADSTNLSKKIQDQRQYALMEALSELFTDKQRDLLFKLLNKQSLTKSDREYYSRVVKKRLKALRNSDLQSLAETILGF